MSSSTSGPLRLAEEYLIRGDVKEALGIYQRISETEPSNLTIKSRLGELCALANQNSDAVKVLADVARTHIREGHSAEAVVALKKILELNPSDPDTLVDVAGLCSRSGLNSEAERYYLEAADVYAGAGEIAKLEAAYESAAAVAPANAEILMKLGAVSHRSGRLVESYRAFMKAAAEFTRRGDDGAALDAYGKALKVAPSGAEAGNAVAEVMKHLGLAENANAASRHRTAERSAPPLKFPHGMGAVEPGAGLPRTEGGRPSSKPEATDDELIVGKISKAELLFGFGRFDQAIALLKELVDLKPNDPRVHRKLKDIYLRSEMPSEAAAVYRELARIYKAEGDEELAADCMASSRRLSGLPAEPALETSPAAAGGQPSVIWQALDAPKEPDLTLITPSLPPNSPPGTYAPARHRTEHAEPEVQQQANEWLSSEDTPRPQASQLPEIVLSTPPVAPVRVSTPPLSTSEGQPGTVVEAADLGGPAEQRAASNPLREPRTDWVALTDGATIAPKFESQPASITQSTPSLPTTTPPVSIPSLPTPPLSSPTSPAGPAVDSGQSVVKSRSKLVSAKAVAGPAPAKAGSSPSTLFGVQLDAKSEAKTDKPGKARYWIAAAIAVTLSGSAGGYFLVRRSQARNNIAAQMVEPQVSPSPLESPATAPTVEVDAVTAESPTESPERQADAANQAKRAADAAAQRQAQYASGAANTTPTPYAPPIAQGTQPKPTPQPNPTPPPVAGPLGAVPATNSGGPSIAPGALARDLPAAPPPPTPGPTVRKSAVMSGGEVLRRVEPVYPQAARSAHITGTVTVELAINEQGNVVSARATSGPGMLSGAAESAARGFKFKPITLDGVPVKSSRTVLFHFKE